MTEKESSLERAMRWLKTHKFYKESDVKELQKKAHEGTLTPKEFKNLKGEE